MYQRQGKADPRGVGETPVAPKSLRVVCDLHFKDRVQTELGFIIYHTVSGLPDGVSTLDQKGGVGVGWGQFGEQQENTT